MEALTENFTVRVHQDRPHIGIGRCQAEALLRKLNGPPQIAFVMLVRYCQLLVVSRIAVAGFLPPEASQNSGRKSISNIVVVRLLHCYGAGATFRIGLHRNRHSSKRILSERLIMHLIVGSEFQHSFESTTM